MSKKMNLSIFLTLILHLITPGFCDSFPFSLCWISRNNVLERKNVNFWLNHTVITTIQSGDDVTSLTVPQSADNNLKLHFDSEVYSWIITTSADTEQTKVKGKHKPTEHPTEATRSVLVHLQTTGSVFACEDGTFFLHQDKDFFLAFGHSKRLPVTLETLNLSNLLMSWDDGPQSVHNHSVSLYQDELGTYSWLHSESTAMSHHHFTGLDSCSPYVACVRISESTTFICISIITEPAVAQDFQVRPLNSSSMYLTWLYPEDLKFSMFLLTAYYVDVDGHVYEVVPVWLRAENYVFTFDDLDPCSRVMFGLQTVCRSGHESRFSRIILNDGNIDHFNIESLHQTSFGPDNYTISWEVQNASSSDFRVYHEGELHGSTNTTSYSVVGLQPCQHYEVMVEALCRDNLVMYEKTVHVHTVPQGVSEIKFRFNDSIASWSPGTPAQPTLGFGYELSLENGPVLERNLQKESRLHLPDLEEGKTYVLDVWEVCDSQWDSERLHLCIPVKNQSSSTVVSTTDGQVPVMEMDYSSMSVILSVPWSLPVELLDDESEPHAKLVRIIRSKIQSFMDNYYYPIHVEVASVELSEEPDKTQFLFMSFDAVDTENSFPLQVAPQLAYVQSLHMDNLNVSNGVIHWTGPDMCSGSSRRRCPRNSLCLNSLDFFTCVCRHGFHDVSPVLQLKTSRGPVCNENGLFSQCLEKMMIGGIAKSYLTSYIGGEVAVKLNDGRCDVEESDVFYLFRTSRTASKCGTERRVNKTHIEFQNIMTVGLTKTEVISRRDLKVVWKCVYPLHYIQNAHFNMDMQWLSALSLVEYNSSQQLHLTMTLYRDLSFSDMYHDMIQLEQEDTLFFQVALQTNDSFASEVLLQVDSCWATESPDPDDLDMGVFIEDGCPVDPTLHWLSGNGLSQTSRFSMQMFHMPKMMPLYFHCLTNICGHDEHCTKTCPSLQRRRRAADLKRKVSALVSAGPLTVRAAESGLKSSWMDHMTMISIVVGLIGVLALTVLSVVATKLILKYWEHVP